MSSDAFHPIGRLNRAKKVLDKFLAFWYVCQSIIDVLKPKWKSKRSQRTRGRRRRGIPLNYFLEATSFEIFKKGRRYIYYV